MIPWCGQLKILAAGLDAVTKISSNEDSRKILLEILWQNKKGTSLPHRWWKPKQSGRKKKIGRQAHSRSERKEKDLAETEN
jgi:hypothetical protein